MKYPNVVEALDRILYLIEKQGVSYRETQETTVNSDILQNAKSRKFFSDCSTNHMLLSFTT